MASFLPPKFRLNDPNASFNFTDTEMAVYDKAILHFKPLLMVMTISAAERFLARHDENRVTTYEPDILIFDEAGQIIEPAMLMLCCKLSPGTVITAGDHEQLPTFVKSIGTSP